MKKIVVLLLISVAVSQLASAQTTTELIAAKIAQRMKDTLQLTETQRQQVYNTNLSIAAKKMEQREVHSGSDSLTYYLQRVENTRDSLYRPLIGEEKYLLYKQKKRNLISGN